MFYAQMKIDGTLKKTEPSYTLRKAIGDAIGLVDVIGRSAEVVQVDDDGAEQLRTVIYPDTTKAATLA